MYQIFLTKQSIKECKRRGDKFKKTIAGILQKLGSNPYPSQARQLSGDLRFIYSYHFNYSGTAFRLAYSVNEKEKTITVLMLSPRENFYQILRQKLA